jgi:hypothetical protein
MSTEFQLTPAADVAGGHTLADVVETCFVRTAEALSHAAAASNEDIFKALTICREAQSMGKPVDLIEELARVLGYDEEHVSRAISELSAAVASTMHPIPPHIPFASKLIAPSSFYESFDALHKLGKALLVPVLYAEDTDAIATGSVNPMAASIFAEEIYQAVAKRFGIRPFMTVVRMDYESWPFLCRKHFEL